MTSHFCAIAACVRWESDHIREWLDYHRLNGIDHVYLYCNDDDAGPLVDVIRDLITGDEPFVTMIHYTLPGLQVQMYLHFIENHAGKTEWFILLDADEFIFTRGHDIRGFLTSMQPVSDCIYLNWMMFGYKGRRERSSYGVLLDHDRRAAVLDHHTKSFVRADLVRGLDVRLRFELRGAPFWHFWDVFAPAGTRIVDPLGEDMRSYSADWLTPAPLARLHDPDRRSTIMQTAFIAHFMFKAESDFARRLARGTEGEFGAQAGWTAADESKALTELVRRMDDVLDDRFSRYWARRTDVAPPPRGSAVLPAIVTFPGSIPGGTNIARDKPATQSSSLYAHLGAGRGNNGIRGRGAGMCSDFEDRAWWSVEFGPTVSLSAIVIYGDRSALVADSGMFAVGLLNTGAGVEWVYTSATPEEFGSFESQPFCLPIDPPRSVCGALVVRLDPGYLHFDEFEAYASAADTDRPR